MFTVDVSVERGTLAEVLPGYGFEKTDAGWIAQKGSGYTSARPLTVGVWEGVQATNSFRLHRESGEYVGMGMATVAFVSDGNVTLLVDGNLRSAGMITQVLIGAKYRRPPN